MTDNNKKQHPGTGAVSNIVQSTSETSISLLDPKRQQLQELELELENVLVVKWKHDVENADAMHLDALDALNEEKEQVRKENGTGRLTPADTDRFRNKRKAIDKRHNSRITELRARKNIEKKRIETAIRQLEREIKALEAKAYRTRDENIKKMNTNARMLRGSANVIMFLVYLDSAPEDWLTRLENTGDAMAISPCHNRDMDRGKKAVKKAHHHVILLYEQPRPLADVYRKFALALEGPNGPEALSTVQTIHGSLRGAYHYLWHDTEKAREDGKFQYDQKDVLHFNGFEMLYEQMVGLDEKPKVGPAVSNMITRVGFANLSEMLWYVEAHEKELPFTKDEVLDAMRTWAYTWNNLCGNIVQHTAPRDSVPERSEEGEQGE